MKIDLFKEKYLDLLIINSKSLDYFKITQEKGRIKVLKNERVEVTIYSQGVFHSPNLEPALQTILKKHKLNELGIVLNLPNIIFQKINLPRGTLIKEAVLNYLKANFPLAIEKYALFYKEDKYHTLPTVAVVNVFLISKEIVDLLLGIVEKYNLIPLFISPSIEIFSHYLLNKTLLDFNEEYLIFLLEENTLLSLLIRNLRLEKVILEEYDPEKISLDLIISRIYNFLKPEIKKTTKIIFFTGEKKDFPEITEQKMFFPSKTINVFLEGGYFTFTSVLTEKQIIDFSPLKNYMAYFLNRLPSIIIFLSVYLFILSLLISTLYFVFQNNFQKEIKNLSTQIKAVSFSQDLQSQLEAFARIIESLNLETFSRFSSIEKLTNLNSLKNFSFHPQALTFSLKVPKQGIEKIKFEINQNLPQAKIIEETILENEVILKYSF